ncbi:4F2 cell-surface antigen heavy chain-like isoform X2 [Penaeus japonicus]|uniref:4F2 cell-surface antigen heavy chain-like isoform X2 n=1 Tax=Penaeus japonicus TaxID=27405 RepID=UPI001C716B68|nr:4F2 cell-surface antigen heavy chain-like isoform X2 [Penaeus japonicus]
MTEDKNGVKNGEANTEMAPQEDGTKVPLTDNECPEAKFIQSNPPNGDARIDVGTVPAFSGLSKEELMKYSNDPFWVRLRWFLFIIFWLGWVAMLVVSIVIIVMAPRCAPQEKLEWVQESAMLQYDAVNGVDADNDGNVNPNDVVEMAKVLGMTSVYLEDLISPLDFEMVSDKYNSVEIEKILAVAKENGLHVVTDFIPSQVGVDNTWFKNESYSDFFIPNSGGEFDFGNPDLISAITDVLRDVWVGKGVKAFLMANADTQELRDARDAINAALKDEVDGAVVSNITDMSNELESGFNAEIYKAFLNGHMSDWTYYKYNPKVAEGKITPEMVRLVTMSLFLVPGTPILSGFDEKYLESQKEEIKQLSDIRMKESIKVGTMAFVNTTNEDVVAYARILKGTPGYAVAVNMNSNNNATIDFTTINGVDESGDVSLEANYEEAPADRAPRGKQDLSNVRLGPYEGIVVQFVPNL